MLIFIIRSDVEIYMAYFSYTHIRKTLLIFIDICIIEFVSLCPYQIFIFLLEAQAISKIIPTLNKMSLMEFQVADIFYEELNFSILSLHFLSKRKNFITNYVESWKVLIRVFAFLLRTNEMNMSLWYEKIP